MNGPAYLGTEAIPKGTDLGEALFLEVLQARLDDRVDSLLGVRVIAIGALGEPLHDIRRRGAGELVAVEDIDDDGVITVLGELVCHKLGVLPDAEDVGDIEQGDAIMLLALWLGHISLVLAYFDGLASGLAAVGVESGWSVMCMHACAVRLGNVARLESLNLKARELGSWVQGHRHPGVAALESNLLVLDTDSAALSRGVGGHVA